MPSTGHFLHQTDKNCHQWCSIKICSTHRKTPVLDSLSDKVSGLKEDNFIKKRLQLRSFPVRIAKFYRTHRWLFLWVWWSNCLVLGVCWLLFLIKNAIWMVSTEKENRSGHSISLHFISRNHSNTFLLINLQKKSLVQLKIVQ